MTKHTEQILKSVMRPIIRLMLSLGINYREFCEICKALFVDVAAEDFGIKGRPTNTSRIALLTGLDRKHVKAVREKLNAHDQPISSSVGQMSRVMTAWYQDNRYLDEQGKPKPLEEKSDNGFYGLAKRYGGDIPAGAIMKELIRTKCVRRMDNGQLEAISRVYNPSGDKDLSVQRATSVISDLCATICHNIFDSTKAETNRFERRAMNINIARDRVSDFKQYIENKGQVFLEEIDAWLSNNELAEPNRTEAIRLGVGLFSFESELVNSGADYEK